MRASLNIFYGEITGIISHDSYLKFTFPAELLGSDIM